MIPIHATRQRRASFWLLACLFVSGTSTAEEPNVAKAREYFRAGAQAYSVGAYDVAIQAFEQANALAPRPAVLFSIAQAERRQYFFTHDEEHLFRAVQMYRRYLTEEHQPARKADAVQALSELEPMVSGRADNSPDSARGLDSVSPPASAGSGPITQPTRVMVSSPAKNVTIVLDDTVTGPSPLVSEVAPGQHLVRFSAPGHLPTERRVIAVAGELVTMDVSLDEQPARLEIVAPTEAQLSIDGRVQGRCPFPKPIEVKSGTHLITISKAGFVGVAREERLEAGKTTVFHASLQRSKQRTAAMFMIGASASALTAGAVFAYFSYKQEQAALSFLETRGRREYSPEDLDLYNNSTRIDRDRLRGAAWASVGVGVGLSVASAFLWIYDGGSVKVVQNQEKLPNQAKRHSPRLLPQPVVGPSFAGFGLQGKF